MNYIIRILFILLLLYSIWYMMLHKKQYHYFSKKVNSPSFSVQCVVARYNENLDWALKLPNLLIYNKGAPLRIPSINLKNVGREGHSYYHHIVTHYDHLPDAIVFLQGYPFDHSPNLFNTLDTLFKKSIQTFNFISEHILQSDINDGSWWHYNIYSYWHKLPSIPKKLPLKIYRRLFKRNPTQPIVKYGTGAQFMVSKDAILKHPKAFYQSIVDMLSVSNNPIEGYIMERFHGLIFT